MLRSGQAIQKNTRLEHFVARDTFRHASDQSW
jgi:hypothetical protein